MGCLDIMAADELDLNGFKTASGEIIEDGGPVNIRGYLENGMPCSIPGRRALVHKPLVAASRFGKKGLLMLMDGHGGTVIDGRGELAEKIKQLIVKEFSSRPQSQLVKLYLENGVYNFYVQNEDFTWAKYNLDSGAAETVMPLEGDEKDAKGVTRFGGIRRAQQP